MYPGVKLVLNQRASAAAWERSINETIGWLFSWPYWLLGTLVETDYLLSRGYTRAWTQYMVRRLGATAPLQREIYERHNDWVRAVARDKGVELLEWKPEMGWAKLCAFLDVEVPQVPFPRVNDTRTLRLVILFLCLRGAAAWALALGCFGAVVFGVMMLR